ncbi:MAG TPA: glycogen debranching N-terminal domain-containing protein [Gemmatimonadales bacterium]
MQPLAASQVRADQRYAWRGPSMLVTSIRGECEASVPVSGYYFREARHLSRLRLLINSERPWLCSDAAVTAYEMAFVYIYPELASFGGGGTDLADDESQRSAEGILKRSIDLRLTHIAQVQSLDCALQVTNRAQNPVTLRIAFEVDADFADIQEALAGGERQQKAAVTCEAKGRGLRFCYQHPRLPLETLLRPMDELDWSAGDKRLECTITLGPREGTRLMLRIEPVDPQSGFGLDGSAERMEMVKGWRERHAIADASGDQAVLRFVDQALDDIGSLALLTGQSDEWLAIQAGIPLYPALFGRDTLTASWQVAMFDRGELTDASLTRLGRMQSHRVFDWRDEEPGRIPYQVRSGPLARLELNPYGAYYADYASPMLFIIAMSHAWAWNGDEAFLRRHWDVARRIMDWARTRGDLDHDGYLEYLTRSSQGTKNQGWKDSGMAIIYEDGRPVPDPLGTCEIQGYWFTAQQSMAVMAWVLGEKETSREFWRSAADLKERFNRDWWDAEQNSVALALDEQKRQARSVTSNVGQCLATGIIDDDHVPLVVKRLFAPDMFSGWGIRTLSSEHVSYNPLSYHDGSIWPVDNATIAFGLRRFGFNAEALNLIGAVFDLARLYRHGRIPECVGGYDRSEYPEPGAYPRANPVQAWNQSGFAMLLQTMLGLEPIAVAHTLVVDPVLPAWLPEIILRNMRLGEATATIRFVRNDSGRSHAEIIEREGPFHLVHQPPVESLTAGVTDRFRGLVETVLHF